MPDAPTLHDRARPRAAAAPEGAERGGVLALVLGAGAGLAGCVDELAGLRPTVSDVVVLAAPEDADGALAATENVPHARVEQLGPDRAAAAAIVELARGSSSDYVLLVDARVTPAAEDLAALLSSLGGGRYGAAYLVSRAGLGGVLRRLAASPLRRLLTRSVNLVFDAGLRDCFSPMWVVPRPLVASMTLTAPPVLLDLELAGEVLRRRAAPAEVATVASQLPRRSLLGPATFARGAALIVATRRRGLLGAPADSLGDALVAAPVSGPAPVRRRWPVRLGIVALALVVGAVVTFLQYGGSGFARSVGIAPPVEAFPELSFVHPDALPSQVKAGAPLSFDFAIGNETGAARSFAWRVALTSGAQTLTLTTGTTAVAKGATRDVAVTVSGLHRLGASRVSVVLVHASPPTEIFFNLGVTS